jgi:N-acetylglucosamine-6-sulfatase
LNEDGKLVRYGDRPQDYSTTVLGGIATRFVQTAKPPFFLHFAPIAPHGPATLPPSEVNRPVDPFTNWAPSFNEADLSDKPWAAGHPPLSPKEMAGSAGMREKMLHSLAAVDHIVGEMVSILAKRGQLDNTVIAFTSDNGFLMGEHRIVFQKIWPYEESIRVPLVIRTPWATGARIDPHMALNIDLAPTLAQLAGVTPDIAPDGRSLVPLLQGLNPPWRTSFVEEFLGRDQRFNRGPPPFEAIRTTRYLYVVYLPGWHELYDLATDPYEVNNLIGQPGSFALQQQLGAQLRALLAETNRAPPPRARLTP